jgi:biotin operon repressor
MRGRKRIQDFMAVLTLTAQRRSVSEIAQQLDCSRNRVIWVQHVLSLRTQRGTGARGLGTWPRAERG